TGPGAGGGPLIRVFDVSPIVQKYNFNALAGIAPSFTGGMRVASADVNGDKIPDIIVGFGPGAGPLIRVFDGSSGAQLPLPVGQFFAFDPAFTGGVFVASGDVNGDGFDDIIVTPDAGGGPEVRVFSGKDGSLLRDFFALQG